MNASNTLKSFCLIVSLFALLAVPLVIAEGLDVFSAPSTPSNPNSGFGSSNAPVSNGPSDPSAFSAPSAPSLGLANGVINVGGNDGTNDALALSKTQNTVLVTTRNPPYFCSFSPVYKKLAVAEQTVFQLQCFNAVGPNQNPIPCPSGMQLYSNAGTPALGGLQSEYVRVINFVAGSTTLNGGVLRATMSYAGTGVFSDFLHSGSFSCQANVDVYTDADSCVITPSQATVAAGEQKAFSVACFDSNGISNAPIPCPDLLWTSDAGSVSGGSTSGATLSAQNVGNGKFLEARYVASPSNPAADFLCRAAIDVTASVSTPTPTPTPTLGQGGNGGGTNGGGNILLPYTNYNYVNNRASPTPTQAPVAPSPSPSPRPTMGHLVLYPVTLTPTPTVAAVAPSGLTGLFTAQLAPLAFGLLLGIIAIALLWYWLAGDNKNAANKEAKADAKKEAKAEAKKEKK